MGNITRRCNQEIMVVSFSRVRRHPRHLLVLVSTETLFLSQMKIRSYQVENGKQKLAYYLNHISCKSLILKAIISIAGAPLDINTCLYPKVSVGKMYMRTNTKSR